MGNGLTTLKKSDVLEWSAEDVHAKVRTMGGAAYETYAATILEEGVDGTMLLDGRLSERDISDLMPAIKPFHIKKILAVRMQVVIW